MKFDFILFDTIGTVVTEKSANNPTITHCFVQAFKMNHILITYKDANNVRGLGKNDAIRELLIIKNKSTDLLPEIYSHFMFLLENRISEFSVHPGANELFHYLNSKNIKIGLGSGLPEEFMLNLCNQFHLKGIFEYVGSSEKLGKGRPNPLMILDAMHKLQINNPKKVLKVGDTVADIEEGKNAGVFTAAVLSGTQEPEKLKAANPDYLFENISGIKTIL